MEFAQSFAHSTFGKFEAFVEIEDVKVDWRTFDYLRHSPNDKKVVPLG